MLISASVPADKIPKTRSPIIWRSALPCFKIELFFKGDACAAAKNLGLFLLYTRMIVL